MTQRNSTHGYDRAVDATMSVIEGRWKTLILSKFATEGTSLRFNQIISIIPGISHRILSIQLRELENDGLISRNIVSIAPKNVEYGLTEKGLSLIPVLNRLAEWGFQNMFSNMGSLDGEVVISSELDLNKAKV